MSCGPTLARLGCDQLGVSTLAQKYTGGSSLYVTPKTASELPDLTSGETYWIRVRGACGSCASIQVVAKDGATLTVVEPVGFSGCLVTGSTVVYDAMNAEAIKLLAAELPFDAVEPLHWDCATRTLSIDCGELKAMLDAPCAT